MLEEKKCGPVTKAEKVGVKSRDACVIVFIFYFLMRPTSDSLHWREKINVGASNYFLSWGICIHMPPLYMP